MTEPELKRLADGVHVSGPHRILFWPGRFAPIRKRFTAIAEAIADKTNG